MLNSRLLVALLPATAPLWLVAAALLASADARAQAAGTTPAQVTAPHPTTISEPTSAPSPMPSASASASPSPAPAQPTPTALAPVVVTATRTATPAFDVPASIDRVDADTVRNGHALVNISESLGGVPGLLARDRQNYAQDVQISVRGFGARSSFGIRGVRLYVDGIPATLPDGQGQITNVDLGSVDSIEVLRGPFSALYGNSAGGVIEVTTEEGRGPPTFRLDSAAGSDGLRRYAAKASGGVEPNESHGAIGWLISGSRFRTDGYRDHSAADRRLGNAKLTLRPDADTTFTLIGNSVDLPRAEDPLGLTRAQFQANPRSADPTAIAFDTRKTVEQTQGGFIAEHRIDANNTLRALLYLGHRGTRQFQSIPVGAQQSPLAPGGVIGLARDYEGVDLRWSTNTRIARMPLGIVVGFAADGLHEHRQGYRNFIGPVLGVQGALRRDERNDVSNLDPYAQASWQITPRWTLDAGVRHSQVRFSSHDAYIVGPNPDDSGAAHYSATLPVAGVLFKASDVIHLYANAGRGFETPTLNELAYRPGGATGLNLGLKASTSVSVEAGVKARVAGVFDASFALFQTRSADEIATLTNVGGRATYQNVGATRRRGAEFGGSLDLATDLRAQVAATWLDAVYRNDFTTCVGSPCTVPNRPVAAGNRLPGVAKGSLFASLVWAPPAGWRGGVETRWLTKVYVDDANSDAAAGYAVAAAHVGYRWQAGPWTIDGFGRVDNLLDRATIGSVIVNEGNGRFFEPAPGRTWLASLSASLSFF